MSDVFLMSAGCLGMTIAIIHGYLGASKVVAPIEGMPAAGKRVLHAIMFLSAIYWFVGGAVLVAVPFWLDGPGRLVAVALVGALYLSGAIANFWATRGGHFGWMLLALTCGLIWLGA